MSTQRNVGKALEKACKGCTNATCTPIAQSYCDTIQKEKDAKRAPSDDCRDPSSACYASYWRRRKIDPDELLKGKNSNNEDLRLALEQSRETAGGAELLMVAIGGLQSFLEERAKAEALGYTVDQLTGRLCNDDYRRYLEDTCKILEADDLELDQATLVRMKKALVRDFARLPRVLIEKLPPTNDKGELAFRAFGIGASDTVFELVTNKLPPKDLPRTWADKDRAAYEKIVPESLRLTCSAGGGDAAPMAPACYALLLPVLGSAAANIDIPDPSQPSSEKIAVAIEAAARSFCAAYGPAGQKENGACLFDSGNQPSSLLADLRVLGRASFRFVELGRKAEKLKTEGMSASEITERLLPELADAFGDWTDALQKVLPEGGKALKLFGRISVTLRASAAAASRDYSELLAVVAESFQKDQAFASVKLPPKVMASIGFAARLASAKKPEDAKKVFEEEAAPLGTYKLKYDREDVTIAVNAFVGPFAAWGKQFAVKDDTQDGFVIRPVSAPLGVDFTLASGKYCHFGFHVAVIDPFGVGTIDPEGDAAELDWGAVVTPGLFARFGIGGSPFTVLAGVVGQPLAVSSTSCANGAGESTPCWKGALQVGGALAVDVPLLVLH